MSVPRPSQPKLRLALLGGLLGVCAVRSAQAQVKFTVSPNSISFGTVTVGLISFGHTVSFLNTGNTSLTINSFSITPFKTFQLEYGFAPNTLLPGQAAHFSVKFAPSAAQNFTGQFAFQIAGVNNSPLVTLSGTGQATTAAASVSPPSLNFGNQPLGTISAPQTLTVSNKGTGPLTMETVVAPPPFAVSGIALPVALQPGNSASFQVTFMGTEESTFTGTLVISYDVLPPSGVGLSGTGSAATSLGITTFSLLPSATQNAPYLATLLAAGGTGQLTWSLAPGSHLPLGLILASSGAISGSPASSVAAGSYLFTVETVDSGQHTARAQLTLPVGKPTGANCSDITFSVAHTSSPIIPLNDLGAGTYLGSEGGLYPNGSNVRPASHDASGVSIAKAIQPLDANGNPDPNGVYVLLSIGVSITRTNFFGFQDAVNGDPTKNPHLVTVNGAIDDTNASLWADPNSGVWLSVLNDYLAYAGVTANQVVAAWVMAPEVQPSGTFPNDQTNLEANLKSIAQNLHSKFPNLVLAYFTSRYYGGYSNGVSTADPEPFAYESGFALKWMIQDQIDGDPALNFDPTKGPVKAPWLSWGPYDWANGLLARSDGLVWTCQDLQADGIHPATRIPTGENKDAIMLVDFFKTDDTTTPWFLAPR